MRKVRAGLLSLALTAGLATALTPAASAAPPETPAGATNPEPASVDELPNPLAEKQRELREAGLQKVMNGEAVVEQRGSSKVVKVGQEAAPGSAEPVDQYVELGRERTDKIFVVLAEFGNERATDIDPRYGDIDTNPNIPGPTVFDGPLHNSIPEPDRSVDNSTIWQPDYNQEHYQQLYFGEGEGVESLKTYYETQSSGRYSVDGMVTDWVKVQYNEARYGRSDGFPCASNVCSNTWYLLSDALDVWVADQYAQGKTDADIAAELASYDVWDRYDYNSNGNFDEPDGYIDHFQIVHAGGDQSDGDPYQGEDAIWAHRWRAFQGTGEGPPNFPIGGTQIGNTGLWVADYTIQPENGGLSVFAHEYGHDLGLPDLYDTTGIGGDGAVGWWSIMAQSRLSDDEDQGIGTRAGDLGPWEKLQLGWFDYEIVLAGERRTMELGPHEYNTDKPQGVVVVLPEKEVVTDLGAPYEGENQYWSGAGDDIDHSMSREVTLPDGPATLEFQARWNIEDCGPDPCDYAYVEVDAGEGWTAIPGSITNPDEGNGIDGLQEEWTPATFDLSAYAGQTIGLRIRYFTDGAVQGQDPELPSGIFVDNIVLTAGGQVLLEDGAETGGEGWTFDGFTIVGGEQSQFYDNYYIASNREYIAYDRYLQTGPYNFGFTDTRPDWVEHFPYQDGLLIWYWDTSFSDNDVGVHPGQGEILPIDAHPRPIARLDGLFWRGRIALYDATFGLQRADSFTLHVNSEPSYIRGQDAVPVFDDRRSYWDERTPYTGVIVPNAGVRIRVLEELGTSVRIRITSTAEAG